MMNHATMSVKMQPEITSMREALYCRLGHAFFDDRRLQIELHPGSDGGSDDSDRHVQIAGQPERCSGRGFYRGHQGVDPGGLGKESCQNISHVKERCGQKNLFHALVLAFDHDEPDDHGANRNRDVFGQAEKFKAAGNSGKLTNDVAEVDDQDSEHHEKRDAKAELLADEDR